MSQSNSNEEPKISFVSRLISSTRYVMALAVIGIFIGSTALLISGTFEMFMAVFRVFFDNEVYHAGQLRVTLIEAVDTVLISTVLYMIAIGLYQLFINNSLNMPPWLRTRGLDDLEHLLAGMIITVLGVIFVTVALESHGTANIMGFGLAIASVIAAMSLFLYQSGRNRHNHPSDSDS